MGIRQIMMNLLAATFICISMGCCPGQSSDGQDSPPSPALNGKVWKAEDGKLLKLNREIQGGAIVDGDTIRLIGLDSSVRIIGIDTEELYRDHGSQEAAEKDFDLYARTQRGDSLRPVKYGTPAGLAAKNFATKFFDGVDDVLFVTDNQLQPRGYYRRHLGHLLVDRDGDGVFEKNFAVEIVRNGLSPYFTKYGYSKRFRTEFQKAELEARENKTGIWNSAEDSLEHYPDYDERLAWWHRRGDALERYESLHNGMDSYYRMGIPGEMVRLKKELASHPDGLRVTLFGSVKQIKNPRMNGKVAVISNKDSRDVPVYWDSRTHKKGQNEDFSPFEGEFVYLKGRVVPSKYRIGFEFRISGTHEITRK